MKCWWCGVEPDEVFRLQRFGYPDEYLAEWPDGDHDHAEKPPTPGELLERGAWRFDSIMRIAAE